ncbi:aromatic acid exporter family protein [Proteinivorax hydrogeniformans]|uniref:Aromatic acid exporter family protein n=1 Tax=Proteinivorax hydrogeniformans TaxID=1826727 RepID=A0AAU8HRS2_9FIRM
MFVGMRIVKTAMAVTVSVVLADILGLNSPFFAAVAAAIAMQGNLVDSFSMGKYRILGTIMGAVFAYIGSSFAHGNPVITGIGILIIIYVANRLDWNKSITISSVVFLSIMLDKNETASIYYSLNRVLDTFVGIVVAVIINFTIRPQYSRDKVYDYSEDLVKKYTNIIEMLILNKEELPLEAITEELDELENEFPSIEKEEKIPIHPGEEHCDEDIDFDDTKKLLHKLNWNVVLLVDMGGGYKLDEDNAKLLKKIYEIDVSHSQKLDTDDIVFNYHLKIALELIEKLSKRFRVEQVE